MTDVTAWNALEEPWRLCLSLAWEAYGAGTIPVGAVLVDAEGAIVAVGRNRVHERHAPAPQLANSRLAHAEVNALLELDLEHRYEDHTLITSLEPCPLCLGAAVMATVGRVSYAGVDPYAGGAAGLLSDLPHVAKLNFRLDGPREDQFGLFASALLVAFFQQQNPASSVVASFRQLAPEITAAAAAIADAGAAQMAAEQVPLAEVISILWPLLSP